MHSRKDSFVFDGCTNAVLTHSAYNACLYYIINIHNTPYNRQSVFNNFNIYRIIEIMLKGSDSELQSPSRASAERLCLEKQFEVPLLNVTIVLHEWQKCIIIIFLSLHQITNYYYIRKTRSRQEYKYLI